MKKKFAIILMAIILILMLMAILALVSCSGGSGKRNSDISPEAHRVLEEVDSLVTIQQLREAYALIPRLDSLLAADVTGHEDLMDFMKLSLKKGILAQEEATTLEKMKWLVDIGDLEGACGLVPLLDSLYEAQGKPYEGDVAFMREKLLQITQLARDIQAMELEE